MGPPKGHFLNDLFELFFTDLALRQLGSRRRLDIAASEGSSRRDKRQDSNRLHGERIGMKK